MKTVRCAIYTRKSSDEGLEQDFNSLHAQREACAAYILSQASEGWTALPDIYDDGGISGGTLERPALQRLLSDVAAGRVDTIVVYKVDRLTRSLIDFSKLVEAFDKAGTSFVSVTQSFNTTTSMGRLTLNMLLSFAQFEREVTAERIRDKIAASKAKGMWMGGTPPLGYEPDGRSLKVIEEHAAIVRTVFELYLELGNVRAVTERLAYRGVRSPTRIRAKTGGTFGGLPFSRGQVYSLLKCPTYIGEVHHNGSVYPGLHDGIIDRDVWDRAQAMLASNLQGHRRGARATRPSLLAGKVVDADGQPLIATHACKGKVRYRYYTSRDLQQGDAATGMRIPARELEVAVSGRIAKLFGDGFSLATDIGLEVAPSDIVMLTDRCVAVGASIASRDRASLRGMVEQVRIQEGRIEIDCSTVAIAEALKLNLEDDTPAIVTLRSEVQLTRSGRMMRLVQANGKPLSNMPDAALIKLVAKAHRWWGELRKGDIDIKRLAEREGVKASYLSRVLRLAFLSPEITRAILAGTPPAKARIGELTLGHGVDVSWRVQSAALS